MNNANQNVYENVYSILWIFALVGATSSYIELQTTTKLAGIGLAFSIIFAFLTIYQQLAVYRDLHGIEKDSAGAKTKYGPWIGTYPEIFTRYGIVISLLFGVGKIANVIYPLFTSIDKLSNYIGFYNGQCLQNVLGGILQPEALLVIGSFFAFLFLLLWNIGAFKSLRKGRPQQKSVDQRVHDLSCVRVGVFILSVAFCLAYWFTVLVIGSDFWVSNISEILLGLYALTIMSLYFLRSDRMLQFVKTW